MSVHRQFVDQVNTVYRKIEGCAVWMCNKQSYIKQTHISVRRYENIKQTYYKNDIHIYTIW